MASDRVIFNVGGARFETTTQTVNSLPDNYFAKLIETHWRDVRATEIFIDRDPACFSHFLNYLRSRVVPGGLSKKEWCALKVEAEYYNILDVLPPDPEPSEELVADDLVDFLLFFFCHARIDDGFRENVVTTNPPSGNQMVLPFILTFLITFHVCLTPAAVEDIGLLIHRIPPANDTCFACEREKHLNYDVFGHTGLCTSCWTDLSGIWKCVESQLNKVENRNSNQSSNLLNSLSDLHSKYVAETKTFTVCKIPEYGQCALLSSPKHPLPIDCWTEDPHPEYSIHIPRKYLRKVGHKEPDADDYLNWTWEQVFDTYK